MWKLKVKIHKKLDWSPPSLTQTACCLLIYCTLEHKVEQQHTGLRWFGELPALFFWKPALARNSLDICQSTKEETEQQLGVHFVAVSSGISQEPEWGYYDMWWKRPVFPASGGNLCIGRGGLSRAEDDRVNSLNQSQIFPFPVMGNAKGMAVQRSGQTGWPLWMVKLRLALLLAFHCGFRVMRNTLLLRVKWGCRGTSSSCFVWMMAVLTERTTFPTTSLFHNNSQLVSFLSVWKLINERENFTTVATQRYSSYNICTWQLISLRLGTTVCYYNRNNTKTKRSNTQTLTLLLPC